MPLPPPDAHARAHSEALAALIRAEIAAAGGWISFARYMELALYAPGLGYYAAGAAKFGAAGDFVTAPEISTLFGRSLARQVAEVLTASRPRVLELGAGTGKLAADLLDALGDACQAYAILETSPDLRERQAATLRRLAPAAFAKLRWLDTLPKEFSGCMLANEVVDALPVHLLHYAADGIFERGVTADPHGDLACADPHGDLAYADRPAQGAVLQAARQLPIPAGTDYVTELNLAAPAWLAALAASLTQGAILLLDYGFPAHEYYHPQRQTGTLMCHYRHHAHDDPFSHPGLTDITAHVDFSALAAAAGGHGLDLLGYASQASFLINCGIADLLATVPAEDSARYLPLANQVNRLLFPAEMGELFKVMLVGRGIDILPLGFRSGDRRDAAARRGSALGHVHAALHRRPRADHLEPALDVRKLVQVDLVPLVAGDPRIGGDVGDAVLAGGQIGRGGQVLVEHGVEAAGFSAVALDAVGNLLLGRADEMVRLAEHRSHSAHLEHQPLQRVVLAARRFWQKLTPVLPDR